MVKVKVKKNIKPKITKQKQTQKTNVVVNISSDIIKKKRGRPSKRSKIEKTTTKPASQQPITQSYIQPIFKQSAPHQPSSLASSILASQNIPKVIKEEVKEESTIKKALTEQNIETDDPISKINDLERVKVERTRKPKIEVIKEPLRSALLSQLISEQGDDTEEIQQLIKFPKPPTTPFEDNELIPIKTKRKEPKINPLVSFSPSIEPPLLSQENKQSDLLSAIQEIPEIQQEAPILNEEEDQLGTIQQEASILIEEGEDQQILEPIKTTPTILETPKKEKTLISSQAAEEPFTEIKVVDEPSNETTTNTEAEDPGLQEFRTKIKGLSNSKRTSILKANNLPVGEINTSKLNARLEARFKEGKITRFPDF
jgi:hypothetical protein